ncbi:MAG TPA: hypothetical protein VHW46_08850 [Terracidiphilus sp.]|jgi:uncharacterized coiled-coil DUF342 family protein|nr:hypothetical protein [Terracidiphilus sp.]
MPLTLDSHTENLIAELRALRQEKAHLVTEIKSDSCESRKKLEAMIRYSYVIEDVRKVSYELRVIGAAY